MPMHYRCATSGQLHDGLPDIGSAYPFIYLEIPENERQRRAQLTDDTCVIDDHDFLIRGVLEIPIHDRAERFGIGVWVSQKRENFLAYVNDPDSTEIGPFFGWLCTRIEYYSAETLALKAMAHFPGHGLRPFIELAPTDHPLAVDQREGITLDKAWEIAHWYAPSPISQPKKPWWKVWRWGSNASPTT
jgi:hypothetical protein